MYILYIYKILHCIVMDGFELYIPRNLEFYLETWTSHSILGSIHFPDSLQVLPENPNFGHLNHRYYTGHLQRQACTSRMWERCMFRTTLNDITWGLLLKGGWIFGGFKIYICTFFFALNQSKTDVGYESFVLLCNIGILMW